VTHYGASIAHHGRRIVPAARSFLLRLPGEYGGLVWNRPAGVRVEEESGARWVPITDRTRRIQIGLLAAGLAAAFLVGRARSRSRRRVFGRRRPRWTLR
jgi:hypothetical protein